MLVFFTHLLHVYLQKVLLAKGFDYSTPLQWFGGYATQPGGYSSLMLHT